jgi:hypothetical protein
MDFLEEEAEEESNASSEGEPVGSENMIFFCRKLSNVTQENYQHSPLES